MLLRDIDNHLNDDLYRSSFSDQEDSVKDSKCTTEFMSLHQAMHQQLQLLCHCIETDDFEAVGGVFNPWPIYEAHVVYFRQQHLSPATSDYDELSSSTLSLYYHLLDDSVLLQAFAKVLKLAREYKPTTTTTNNKNNNSSKSGVHTLQLWNQSLPQPELEQALRELSSSTLLQTVQRVRIIDPPPHPDTTTTKRSTVSSSFGTRSSNGQALSVKVVIDLLNNLAGNDEETENKRQSSRLTLIDMAVKMEVRTSEQLEALSEALGKHSQTLQFVHWNILPRCPMDLRTTTTTTRRTLSNYASPIYFDSLLQVCVTMPNLKSLRLRLGYQYNLYQYPLLLDVQLLSRLLMNGHDENNIGSSSLLRLHLENFGLRDAHVQAITDTLQQLNRNGSSSNLKSLKLLRNPHITSASVQQLANVLEHDNDTLVKLELSAPTLSLNPRTSQQTDFDRAVEHATLQCRLNRIHYKHLLHTSETVTLNDMVTKYLLASCTSRQGPLPKSMLSLNVVYRLIRSSPHVLLEVGSSTLGDAETRSPVTQRTELANDGRLTHCRRAFLPDDDIVEESESSSNNDGCCDDIPSIKEIHREVVYIAAATRESDPETKS